MDDLEQARALSRQDCPLPALAGPALKRLVERVDFLEGAMRAAAATLERDADEHGVAAALRMALGENAGYAELSLDTPLQRFGKKLAGRLLDGVEHNGYPEASP